MLNRAERNTDPIVRLGRAQLTRPQMRRVCIRKFAWCPIHGGRFGTIQPFPSECSDDGRYRQTPRVNDELLSPFVGPPTDKQCPCNFLCTFFEHSEVVRSQTAVEAANEPREREPGDNLPIRAPNWHGDAEAVFD